MLDAALFLFRRSAANRIRHLARKVRSPRYLIALLLGIAYLVLVFLAQVQQTQGPAIAPLVQGVGTVLLLVLVGKWWLFGTDRMALAFTPAEIQFFFPAPVTRRALLGYKLLRAQLPILINVAIWVILLQRGRDSVLPTAIYALSLWTLFMVLMLHRLGVALSRDAMLDYGVAGLRRHWVTIVVGVLLLLMFGNAITGLMALRAEAPDGSMLSQLTEVLDRAPLSIFIAPFELPLSLLNSPDLAAWGSRFVLMAGLIGIHVVWVFQADRAFEEAAVAASVKRAKLIDRLRRQGVGTAPVAGAHRRSLPLGGAGHPIGAIVWKNLTRLARTSSGSAMGLMLLLFLGVLLFSLFMGREYPDVMNLIFGLSFTWAAILSLLGPQWIRNDLRTDLEHLDQLRTWPVSGTVVVTAEVLSSGLALTVIQSLLVLVGVAAISQHNQSGVPLHQVLVFTLPVLLLLATVNLLSLAFQNGAAILYPAWVKTELKPGGVEAMGQYLLTAGASLVLLTLALAGPVGAGGVVTYLLWTRFDVWSLLPGIALAILAILLELALLIDWLGTRFESLDPTFER